MVPDGAGVGASRVRRRRCARCAGRCRGTGTGRRRGRKGCAGNARAPHGGRDLAAPAPPSPRRARASARVRRRCPSPGSAARPGRAAARASAGTRARRGRAGGSRAARSCALRGSSHGAGLEVEERDAARVLDARGRSGPTTFVCARRRTRSPARPRSGARGAPRPRAWKRRSISSPARWRCSSCSRERKPSDTQAARNAATSSSSRERLAREARAGSAAARPRAPRCRTRRGGGSAAAPADVDVAGT